MVFERNCWCFLVAFAGDSAFLQALSRIGFCLAQEVSKVDQAD